MPNEAPDVVYGNNLEMTLFGQRQIMKWSVAVHSEYLNTHTEGRSPCSTLAFLFNTAEFLPVW